MPSFKHPLKLHNIMKRLCTLVAIKISSRLRPFSHEPMYLSVRPWVSVAHTSVVSMHVVTVYVFFPLYTEQSY